MNLLKDVWHSISRRDPLSTDKGKSEFVFHNIWLHVHPAKVRRDSLKVKHTWYLGFISFYLLMILITTGIALMFYYRPYPSVAYRDIRDLQFVVFLGGFIRNMHRWAAHGMVACVFLHMCRVFYTGSYKKPRQFNWVIGVILLIITLGLSFTGYLLPWDQLAFWAITVGTNIGSYAPVVGGMVRETLLGGHSVGEAALLRFYVLHVAVLPGMIILFTMVHFWRIRKDGGLSTPTWELNEEEPQQLVQIGPLAAEPVPETVVSAAPTKTYGLMEVVVGKPLFETIPPKQDKEEDSVMAYPYAFLREGVALMFTVVCVMAISLVWNAPLEEIANPAKTPNPAKAPWYFLGLQELVSYSALIGGVIVPGLIVLGLLVIPYIDRNPSRQFSKRKAALWIFTIFALVNLVLIVIGTFFRGPGWSFVPPWVHVVAGGE